MNKENCQWEYIEEVEYENEVSETVFAALGKDIDLMAKQIIYPVKSDGRIVYTFNKITNKKSKEFYFNEEEAIIGAKRYLKSVAV